MRLQPPLSHLRRIVKRGVIPALLVLTWSFADDAFSQDDPAPLGTTSVVQVEDSVHSDHSAQLANRLQAIYARLDGFENIRVESIETVVRLTGIVASSQIAERAEALAAAQSGVNFVINDLTTDTEVRSRLSPAVDRVESYLDGAIAYLPIVALALIVLVLFSLVGRWIGNLDRPLARLGMPPMIRTLVGRLVSLVVFVIGLVLALDILDVTALVGTVLGAAGLAGVAIGFAFKDIVENYLAGVLLSIRRPFSLNDHVKIDDVEGKALLLTSRELLLMTLDGNHVRLPNSAVFKATIYNYTRNPRRRFDFEVGIGVDEDLVAVSEIGLQTLGAISGILRDPGPAMIVVGLGDSNVVVRFFAWVDQEEADFGKARSAGIRLVKDALDEAGISMPEPIYAVKLEGADALQTPTEVRTQDARRLKDPDADTIAEQARSADVDVDTSLEHQMREDLAQSDEPNLLSD